MAKRLPQTIHAVVFRSSDGYVAQCLEYDIATQATSVSALLYEVDRIIAAHLLLADQEGNEPFASIPRAPRRFWQMYREANARLEPVRHARFPTKAQPRLELRAA
jgi:hypothetical protein